MRTKKGMIIIAFMAILVFGGIAFILSIQGSKSPEVGTKANDTEAIIKKRKKQKVDKSILAATMDQVIEFEDGKSEGTLNIENLPENNYNIKVEITDKNKEVLYSSQAIEPGMIIRKDKLEVELEKGKHLCNATFRAYDEDGKEVNKANAQIEISIKK